MTYKEYRDKVQGEINALPIFWAFGEEQFKEEMKKRGLPADKKLVYGFPGGGMYLRTDAQIIRDYFKNKPRQLRELMKDPAFAEDAFYTEMLDHEYDINSQGDWEVCSCFGNVDYKGGAGALYYLTELEYSDDIKKAFRQAAEKFFKDAEEWY